MQFRIQIAGQQLKLEIWSLFLGSAVADVLVLYAGSPFWLFFTGFIFGTMSRRGVADFCINGLASSVSFLLLLLFLGQSGIPGMESILLFLSQRSANAILNIASIIAFLFLVSGLGAVSGSLLLKSRIFQTA
jgi:hypothetical protein